MFERQFLVTEVTDITDQDSILNIVFSGILNTVIYGIIMTKIITNLR